MSIYHLRRRKRLIFAFFVFAALFLVLAIRLTSIQAFDSINLTDEQIDQLMGEIPLTATRGDIYDRNMNILAKDASASAIYVRPKDVKKPEEIADYLSEVLELDREKLYKKITDKSQWISLIERKVDNDIAFDIRNKKFKGVEISEDKKRYYTNGNFASYVLGFTGTDHQGLYGIESVFNNVLSGEDGVLVYEKDGLSQKVASGYQVRIKPDEGDNVVLTIDSIIQHFLESQLEKTMDEFDSKRVIAIAMDPSTGEILAMSSKPDYNLNDPRTVSKLFESKMSTELEGMDLGKKQLEMWKNPAVTFNYEPGSTFKPITAAAALEEGAVTAQTSFFDKGYIIIDGQQIKCHIFPRSHGSQTFVEAVANSCNPVLVETVMRMEPVTFYRYIYNFGFGDQTGIQLDGEQAGIVPNNNDKLINYVPKSYGQGISVTPIQLISALSAVTNDGKYMQPNIVKYILSSDNNEIIKEYKPEQIRQVVSEDTANIVQDILKLVVSNSENLSSMSAYKIGGKTGTAQKIINGAYASGLYITSFFGYAPVDDPKIAVLYIVDEPKGYGVYGSNTAAPHAIEFMNNTLDYLNVPGGQGESLEDSSIVPDLRNQELDLAKEVLNYLKLKYEIAGEIQSGYIVNQDPMPGELIKEDTVIKLTLGEEITQEKEEVVTVPNVMDMTVQQANETLSRVGLKLAITGAGGVSTQQSPLAGEQVQKGSEIVVEFKPLE
ncbi:stage V sporulation protein D (sporulation-specific penicillin-binding protein) [Alkalibaculum bacchi]|uniref:Stage V sporulation protein D (Sporulation-specific penicillin-binding protein) n=1 Tax=Alkalibaculum bacchi TaxID=645887 RepID=A0A366I5A6_9FIRM|nr:penicillin-binding transpeptidase domain-containing protein [Alkalibaculum bacchi]RBP61805.1 stage V sporulation protein D (sporulation-specific penicillin-binding protein) [Alkalibaculum bacchi]